MCIFHVVRHMFVSIKSNTSTSYKWPILLPGIPSSRYILLVIDNIMICVEKIREKRVRRAACR